MDPRIRPFILPVILPPFENVLGRLGYNPKKTSLDEKTEQEIRDALKFSGSFIHPKAHAMELPVVKCDAGSVTLEEGLVFHSAKLAQVLAKARQATVLACTIGQELKEETDRLTAAGEMTRAVILDAIASEAVEAFADHINEILAREHSLRGLKPAMRFSPGYGDLRTDIHAQLLPLLRSEEIGIRFHPENFILYPEKSISAVIGWFR